MGVKGLGSPTSCLLLCLGLPLGKHNKKPSSGFYGFIQLLQEECEPHARAREAAGDY